MGGHFGGSWGHSGGFATSVGHIWGASGSALGLFRDMGLFLGAILRVLIIFCVFAPEPECGRSPQLRLGVRGPLAPAPAPLLCRLWLPLGLHLRHLRRPLLLQPLPGHPPGHPVRGRGHQDSQYGDMGTLGTWGHRGCTRIPSIGTVGMWGGGGWTGTPSMGMLGSLGHAPGHLVWGHWGHDDMTEGPGHPVWGRWGCGDIGMHQNTWYGDVGDMGDTPGHPVQGDRDMGTAPAAVRGHPRTLGRGTHGVGTGTEPGGDTGAPPDPCLSPQVPEVDGVTGTLPPPWGP